MIGYKVVPGMLQLILQILWVLFTILLVMLLKKGWRWLPIKVSLMSMGCLELLERHNRLDWIN